MISSTSAPHGSTSRRDFEGNADQTVGVGQRYIASYRTRTAHGSRARTPTNFMSRPNPPAKNFWSVTPTTSDAADPVTEQGRPDISSRKEDIVANGGRIGGRLFGRKAPEGKEANWVQTNPDKGWFAYFRFYGPTEAFFDKSWAAPDIRRSTRKS